ncbi:hypothetical protein CVT25_013042 [Psilocybe cyanescens]|uniref:Endonuclease/exonuclease/phosphatase domain-containing protein n=1 Tax=Psilocybe cyanescens TaxID=93625 RepID=A0A409XSP8_PSICY|nr:hypothetical protein CVT25_013042 [Psilocybe cyanescens]
MVTARDNTAQPSDTPSPARTEDEDMEDSPTYLSLSYGDANVVENSHRILGALRTIIGYVNSSNIDLHSSPMGASLAQALVDFTCKTFNGDLGTTPTPNNILPIRAVAEIFAAENDTIQRPLAIGPTSPDPLCISSPPAWSDHGGAGNDNIVMTPAEPVRSSHRSAQARPPIRAQQDKGKGRADKPPPPPPAPPQPHPPAKKPVVPNQRPPPVPPSSTRLMRPAPRSYTEAARKKAPAAPLSRPASRKGRRIPDYTSHSPSRRQLLIDMGDHAKDANLTTLFKDLSSDVLSCQGLRVKVLGVEIAYDGYAVPTDKVPSERDTDILCGAVTTHFKAHYKFMPWVGMPMSKSFLRIVDVPQFQGTHYDLDHLTKREEVASALKASPIWTSSHILCWDPCIVRTSKASTTATAFFDIWDTTSGARACQLVDKQFMFRGRPLWIHSSWKSSGVPLCTQCWKWGHPVSRCNAVAAKCPHCSGSHKLEEHRAIAGCCKGNPKADPSQAPMPGGEPCPHTPCCPNCGKNHSAHEGACVFWSHRFDQLWHVEKYCQVQANSFVHRQSLTSTYDIVFIQEPPWRFVRTAPSTSHKSGDDVISAPLHPAWLPMVCNPEPDTRPRIMAYVSNCLKEFWPSMRRDLIDHRDVLILSLFANGQSYNLMNVYSDETHMAALLLAEEAASLPPFIYMGGDFKIHSQEWDGGHRGHPGVATQLLNTAAELGLQQAPFVNPGPTFYPHIQGFRSTVIDLVFVQPDQTLTAQVTRVHNAQGESDHIPLATILSISADSGATPRRALKADREEQIRFVRVIKRELAMKVDEHTPLDTPDQIDEVAQAIADSFSAAWETWSRKVTITRRSKLWWTDECSVALQAYWEHGLPEDWKLY